MLCGIQRRTNAQSCGQNTAELSASVFPSAEDLQGMNSRDESYTVYTPRGWKKGDEHAREAWQINWESETTRGGDTETTLQSKFNYLPTPAPVSPFENPTQHGWMERYSWLKLICPSKDQETDDNCFDSNEISCDFKGLCACSQARLMLKLFIQSLRDYFAIVIDGHSFTFI